MRARAGNASAAVGCAATDSLNEVGESETRLMKSIKILTLAAVGMVVVAAIGLSVWATGRDDMPPSNADVVAIAKILGTERWDKLSEDQRRPYMSTLRKNADAVSQALAAGKITRDEHDLAKHNIWLERQLDKMDDYYKLPPGPARQKYLDELVRSKIEKRKGPQKPKDPNEPDTDEDSPFMEKRKELWPQDMEERWDNFFDALDAREKAHGL